MATAQYINSGGSSEYTPETALDAGSVVVQGDRIGINNLDIPAGEKGTLLHRGKFELPKDNATAFDPGVDVYWDESAQEITETTTDNIYFGKCEGAVDTAETIRVDLIQ
jgi:predicted RecA/RadA family phage recombinase